MIRPLALSVSFLLACALPARAQVIVHHQAGHLPPDSAHHAAMHALMSGAWTGFFSSPHADSSGMSLSIAHDDSVGVTLRLTLDEPFRAGLATNLMMIKALTLQWTQDVSGNSCKATAVVSPATDLAPATMEGKMVCEHGELAFTLYKKTG